MYELQRYQTANGKDVIGEWLADLKDLKARARVAARMNRLAAGNFGDCKRLREGVCELRVDYGPGYRVYYAVTGRSIILLLCGGDKRRQASDIDRAVGFFEDFKRRSKQ